MAIPHTIVLFLSQLLGRYSNLLKCQMLTRPCHGHRDKTSPSKVKETRPKQDRESHTLVDFWIPCKLEKSNEQNEFSEFSGHNTVPSLYRL